MTTESSHAYATWDEAVTAGRVTDDPDGYPDARMVPLVEALRERGIVTLQSCQGHDGSNDGHLWIRADTVADPAHRVDMGVFDSVRRVWTAHEERWEFWWSPDRADAATQALSGLTREDQP